MHRKRLIWLMLLALLGIAALGTQPLWKIWQPGLQARQAGKNETARTEARNPEVNAGTGDTPTSSLEAPQGAIIHDVRHLPPDGVPSEAASAATAVPDLALNQPLPASRPLRTPQSSSSPARNGNAQPPAKRAPKGSTEKPKSTPKTQNASRKATSASTTRQASPPPRGKSDPDVALLTELVAVVNKEEGKGLPSQASTISAAGKAAVNRDIVERTPNDSTASLLARCNRLGILEGQLCRWRICSGYESDPACAMN